MRAIYLALATWAFAESVRLLVAVEYPITRGGLGLKTAILFGASPAPYSTCSSAWRSHRSWSGGRSSIRAWALISGAIRDDEEADTFRYKRLPFVISAIFAAVAGGFLGHYIGLLSPTPMKFNEMAIIMVIAGGFRTFAGPVLGAVTVELLSEALRPLARDPHGSLRPARDRDRPRLSERARGPLRRGGTAPVPCGPPSRPHAHASPTRLRKEPT
jgi:branched-chain amino acid transport system permease protein